MEKTVTHSVKKEIAIIITIIAFVGGFLGGIVFSAFKTAPGSAQYAGSQSSGEPPPNTQEQENRILTLKQEVAANPDNSDAMIELGDIFLDSNRYQEAIAIFTRAEKISPANIHILNDLGLLHMRTGNYEASLAKFEAVLKIDPTHSHTIYYVGMLHRDNGETDKALQAFEKVLSLDPDSQLAETVRQEITVLKDQMVSQ